MTRKLVSAALMGSIALASLTGCESLPGGPKEQGTVIGGVGGAAAGAAIAKNNRLAGALIGGALGAGGGWLIGSQVKKNNGDHKDEAIKASQQAEASPATAADVAKSSTADLNGDGFVTMDEVVAMEQAGLKDPEMISRLRATGQVFDLTAQQENYLRDRGVDEPVLTAMRSMNQDATARTAGAGDRLDQPKQMDNANMERIGSQPKP
jgi:hypothetical protein